MAGSYRHVTNADGSYRGSDLLDNLGDASEAVEEMHAMIAWLAQQVNPDDPRRAIWQAHNEGYLFPNYPWNRDTERASFDSFWE